MTEHNDSCSFYFFNNPFANKGLLKRAISLMKESVKNPKNTSNLSAEFER